MEGAEEQESLLPGGRGCTLHPLGDFHGVARVQILEIS